MYFFSYSHYMWSGGSSGNLLYLIKRWVFNGIRMLTGGTEVLLESSFFKRNKQSTVRNVLYTSVPKSTASLGHCALKCWLFLPWYKHSPTEEKLFGSVDVTISRALILAQLNQRSISSDFREDTKPFPKSVFCVPLTALLLICSNGDRHEQVRCVTSMWIWLSSTFSGEFGWAVGHLGLI